LALIPLDLRADAPLVGTAGNNLTAFNGGFGAMDNNQWNLLTNTRTAPAANFGNCNALILRCAQPKCSSGGCASMDIAHPIVSGCVMSNESCRGHGEALIQTIAAQMVAASVAKANEQAAAAQAAAAQNAAAQSEAQYQQMQMQMQQMQAQMSQQSAQQIEQLQAALEEQKQIAANAAAEAAAREAAARAAAVESTVATSVVEAAEKGVSADVLAREQIGNQILSQLENAQVALESLQGTMQNAFDYARCDSRGDNCVGPKRVKVFKQKANEFFDPYETVLDEVYDALILAQSLGVDITDIYMMLNGSCNVWGQYMCSRCSATDVARGKIGTEKEGEYYCEAYASGGITDYYWTVAKIKAADGSFKVAPRQQHCTLVKMMADKEEVQQNWLDMGQGSSGGIRVACASDALDNSVLFRNRKKQASIDLETLQRLIEQDAPTRGDVTQLTRFCSVGDDDIPKLQLLVQKKALTSSGGGWGKVCVADKSNQMYPKGVLAISAASKFDKFMDCNALADEESKSEKARCDSLTTPPEKDCVTEASDARKKIFEKCEEYNRERKRVCELSDGTWDAGCKCPPDRELNDGGRCLTLAEMTKKQQDNNKNHVEVRWNEGDIETTTTPVVSAPSSNTSTSSPFRNSATINSKRDICTIVYGGEWKNTYCNCVGVGNFSDCMANT
jgi:hypothetical protein